MSTVDKVLVGVGAVLAFNVAVVLLLVARAAFRERR